LDSFALGKVVFDRILYHGEKVERRHPSSLDVAYSVLGNNHVAPELARDSHPYFHNLEAMRQTIEQQESTVWDKTIYMNWLAVLRELSQPTTDEKYPEVMRTQAWAMKDTATQLASWAQLRHDTLLYVKQSYGMMACCEYPACFVDPRPHFWNRFEQMASNAAKTVKVLNYPKSQNHAEFFSAFAQVVKKLAGLADREVKQEPFTKEETNWLKTVVNIISGGSGPPTYDGWYCSLFYKSPKDSCTEEYIVADVHTNPPDDFDPGHVLHEAVGPVNLMIISVNSGKDKVVYCAPVFSYFEIECKGLTRMSDKEWTENVEKNDLPARPSWTASYLSVDNNPKKVKRYY